MADVREVSAGLGKRGDFAEALIDAVYADALTEDDTETEEANR